MLGSGYKVKSEQVIEEHLKEYPDLSTYGEKGN
ncbi:hypothetical protein C5S53_13565 [Methanophagales archaeon]|nr:hypothetical protein C5S53_13565 [Methanophagales archaeon]